MSMTVIQPGILSLLQDNGRIGKHRLGLTNGGPLDSEAFHYCNRLLGNAADATAIEVSVGGLQLEASVDTYICVTGAAMPFYVNDEERSLWRVYPVNAGDRIHLGFATSGCRSYLNVADGFLIKPSFGSTATVMRESIGGINGDKLSRGDQLPCAQVSQRKRLFLSQEHWPRYQNALTVRVVPGYQQRHFDRVAQRRFFGGPYRVSQRCDRMGYRLEGAAIESDVTEFLSEGICYGAIQIPPDGQPIVLLNDRQTIGGYPKIGSALSLDAARLTQMVAGSTVHFAPISVRTAQKALHLARRFTLLRPLKEG
jgi:biotin-dependent carboxylase-like uncharacterized protein